MKAIKIVGGGLSGLSLGIALRRRSVPVVIYEAGQYPRHKVCGEFICGVSEETLDSLGITDMFEDAPQYTKSKWFSPDGEILNTELEKPAWGISRYQMDDWLQKRFRGLGGELVTGKRIKCEARQGRVWAAGRIPSIGARWLGLKMHVRGYDMKSELEMHLGGGGYVGLVVVEDDWINVCGLFEKRKISKVRGESLIFQYLKTCGLDDLVDDLRCREIREGSESAVAGFDLGRQQEIKGLCVIGDSENMIPPFTGNGMSMAFESAEIALQFLLRYANDKVSWEKCCVDISSSLKKKFRTRLATSALCHPFLMNKKAQHLLKRANTFDLLPFSTLFRLSR